MVNYTLGHAPPQLDCQGGLSDRLVVFSDFNLRQPSCYGEVNCSWEKTKKWKDPAPASDLADIKGLRKHPWRAP